MQARFETKKAQIVQRLARPEHEYNDSSPKGSVDESIRELVNEINSTPGYVTTSSCSGRVAVYLEGPKHDKSTNETQNRRANEANRSSSTSGKGGGRWLFTSHNPVDITDFDNESSIYSLLDIEPAQSLSFPVHGQKNQLVHLKFEPMILHILTSSIEKAQLALNAALAAGFRESGISSAMDSKGSVTPPMVAVRSSGMAFGAPVAFLADDRVKLMVPENYLRTLLNTANDHFLINKQRIERFRSNFLDLTAKVHQETTNQDISQGRKKVVSERQLRKEARKFAVDHGGGTQVQGFGDDDEAEHSLGLLLGSNDT